MTDDHGYFYFRAEQELEMAQKAEKPEAVKAHYELANRYLERVIPGDVDASELMHRNQREPEQRKPRS